MARNTIYDTEDPCPADQRTTFRFDRNKANVMAALREREITSLSIIFDGECDEGVLREGEITFEDGRTEEFEELIFDITVLRQKPGSEAVLAIPLNEAIFELCFDVLESWSSGWQNGLGTLNTLTFEPETNSIDVDQSARTYIERGEVF